MLVAEVPGLIAEAGGHLGGEAAVLIQDAEGTARAVVAPLHHVHVRIFDGRTGNALANWMAFEPQPTGRLTGSDPAVAVWRGGVRVGVVAPDDGLVEVLAAAGAGEPPLVRRFRDDWTGPLDAFFAAEPRFHGGIFVAGG